MILRKGDLTLSMNMYADGYLEDTESHYKYYIPISEFERLDEGNLALLLDSNEPYEHKLDNMLLKAGMLFFTIKFTPTKQKSFLNPLRKVLKTKK